jgi:hypothetical protein
VRLADWIVSGDAAFIASLLGEKARAVELSQEAFAQGLPFNVRWRLHAFADLKAVRDYPAFRRMLEAQG